MAPTTLTPSSESSATVLATGSHPSEVRDSTELPFQIYSNLLLSNGSGNPNPMFSQYFCTGAANQVAYTFKKLGGDVLDIEITTGSIFSAYEEAVLEYSYIVNVHQAKNVLGSALGAATGTFDHDGEKIGTQDKDKVNLRYPKWQFSYGKKVGDAMATEAGFGGATSIYSASFQVTASIQDYDLQDIVEGDYDNASSKFFNKINNKRVHITKVWYKTPQAMWRFFGYYGGLNTVGDLASYGQFADDSTFEIIPAWQNKLQAMAFEDAIYTRNSHYSYEIKNNKLRLFPAPHNQSAPERIWFEFYVKDDVWDRDTEKDDGVDGVNNMNTLPFENLPYENINSIGKQWIRRFTLALSKETLGQVRSKFGSIPIPGETVSLNGTDLISQGQQEQEKLREELKTTLDELTYAKLAEKDAAVAETVMSTQGKIPYPVPIVTG